MSPSDHQLLREYAIEKRESAFTELTRRHLNLAWGAAKRITGDAELARDVAQTTFTLLARKARFMPESVVVAGWIYRTACLEARKMLRDAARRSDRESKAMELDTLQPPDPKTAHEIEALLPDLDTALCHLTGKDRDAVVLRFLENKSLANVGRALGISEDAAQKRVSRALEKLRSRIKKPSATLSIGILTSALGIASSQAAPSGLALAISATSVSSAAVSASGISTLLFNLQTQAAFMKTQLLVGSISIVAVTTPLAVQQHTLSELRAENQQLVQAAVQVDALQEQRDALVYRDSLAREFARLQENHEEILRLREETAALNSTEIAEKIRLSQRLDALQRETERINHESKLLANEGQKNTQIMNEMGQLAYFARLFSIDHENRYPLSFNEIVEDPILGKDFIKAVPDLSQYEYYPHEEPVNPPNRAGVIESFLFREQSPRLLRSGEWTRIYVFNNGATQQAFSPTSDFSAWEEQTIGEYTGTRPIER